MIMYVNEAIELGEQTDDFEEGETSYTFDSIPKVTKKMFRYYDKKHRNIAKFLNYSTIQNQL